MDLVCRISGWRPVVLQASGFDRDMMMTYKRGGKYVWIKIYMDLLDCRFKNYAIELTSVQIIKWKLWFSFEFSLL